MFIDLKEKGGGEKEREREREREVGKTLIGCLAYTPQPGINTQHRHVP